MLCPNCGREMVRRVCANLHCPSITWRNKGKPTSNVVELSPAIERDATAAVPAFVGSLYVKEIRLIDDYPCQGVSLSTVAVGGNRRMVQDKTSAEAKQWAKRYLHRGYKVVLKKVACF